MTIDVRKYARLTCLACLNIFALANNLHAQSGGSIQLNDKAVLFASELVNTGHIITDDKGAWHHDKPSFDAENAFIRAHGFAEYAKWHLGIDTRFPDNSKRRYKFPFGDFANVHR